VSVTISGEDRYAEDLAGAVLLAELSGAVVDVPAG
jgi:hypothetical protein